MIRAATRHAGAFNHDGIRVGRSWVRCIPVDEHGKAFLLAHGRLVRVHPDDAPLLAELGLVVTKGGGVAVAPPAPPAAPAAPPAPPAPPAVEVDEEELEEDQVDEVDEDQLEVDNEVDDEDEVEDDDQVDEVEDQLKAPAPAAPAAPKASARRGRGRARRS